jgi:hypothetical protein
MSSVHQMHPSIKHTFTDPVMRDETKVNAKQPHCVTHGIASHGIAEHGM